MVYIVMADMVMACVVMAYIAMTYIVMDTVADTAMAGRYAHSNVCEIDAVQI